MDWNLALAFFGVVATLVGSFFMFGERLIGGVVRREMELRNAATARAHDHEVARRAVQNGRESGALSVGLTALGAGVDRLLEQRVSASSVIWKAVVANNKRFGLSSQVAAVSVPQDFPLKGRLADIATHISEQYDNWNGEAEEDRDAELLRPFVSPELWQLFFTHRAFLGRLMVRLAEDHKKGRTQHWTLDPAVWKILSAVFDAQEVQRFRKCTNPCREIQAELEGRILGEIQRSLTGADLVESQVERAITLAMAQPSDAPLP